MGWNRVRVQQRHPLFDDLPEDNELYFVHSYYLDPADPSCVIGTTEHGIVFASALCHDNLTAVQFHPEKSGPLGLALLGRFASWSP
jgi:glutamine amidotransferase